MAVLESSRRGAPLCPVGHLPHEGRDWQRHGFPSSFNLASKRESGGTAISPLVGEMPTGRWGRLALSFLMGLVSATPALAACPQELAIYEDGTGQSLTFTPPPVGGQAAEHSFSIRIGGQDLQGVVMWSADPDRPNGIIMDHCPDGDVTGEELDVCTVWQGVIYALKPNADAGFLGKRGSDHAVALLLPDFSRAVQNHVFKNPLSGPPKADDVFKMKACQE
jgi:hypothetical protein